MANKTISLPDEVLPIIDRLDVPFSTWVADQLRRYSAAQPKLTLRQQLLVDAERAGAEPPNEAEKRAVAERMERSASW